MECIKDKKRFTSEELEAIKSLDYNQRKKLSDVDVITIQNLYSAGEVMALHEHGNTLALPPHLHVYVMCLVIATGMSLWPVDFSIALLRHLKGSLTRVPCHEPEAQSTVKITRDYVNIMKLS